MSIDSIIKQAMADAGLKPEEEIEKKATGNKLADELYALASTLEKLGNAKVGAVKTAEQSCLRDLTKAYLFQRMLKSAVEDRLGIVNTETIKSAGEGESDVRVEYLKAFEKLASEKKALDIKRLGAAATVGLGLAGAGYGAYKLLERGHRVDKALENSPARKNLNEAGERFENALDAYFVHRKQIAHETPFYPKKAGV